VSDLPEDNGSPSFVGRALDALYTASLDAQARLRGALDPSELIAAWADLTNATLEQLFYCLALRGQTIERMEMYCLYTLPGHVLIYDKDVGDDLNYRLLPRTKLANRILNEYARGLADLARALVRLGIKLRDLPTLDTCRPHAPAFFRLAHSPEATDALRQEPVDRHKLAASSERFFGREGLNLGRHDLVTVLLARGEPRYLPRVLTGHATRGAEVSGDASLLPPRDAIHALEVTLEHIIGEFGIDTPAEAALVSRRLVGPVPSANDPYVVQRIDGHFRILPPAIDRYTPIAIAVTKRVRQELRNGRGPDSPWARFALSLACFNALSLSDAKIILAECAPTVLAAPAPLLVWTRPKALELAIPLNPVPALLLCAAHRADATDPWPRILRDIGAWARRIFPDLSWPLDAPNAATGLFALVGRYIRFISPPAALAAASDAVAAAVYNRESLARNSDDTRAPAATPSAIAPALPLMRNPQDVKSPLKQVAAIAHKYGALDDALGGEHQRAVDAERELEALSIDTHGPAATLRKWLLHECYLRVKSLKNPVQWSTLSKYVGEVQIGLRMLTPLDDLRQWDAGEWIEFAEMTIPEIVRSHRKTDDPRYSGLKRMFRIGASLGWHIPPSLYAAQISDIDRLRVSAASTAILKRDIERVREYMATAFHDEPLLGPAAALALSLFTECGPRSAEVFTLPCDCVERATHSIVFKEGPHSHLKSDHGWRAIPVSPQLIADLDRYVVTCRSESRFLFLDKEGKDWRIAHRIHAALSEAIRHVTRSPSARVHSFRSAAEMSQLYTAGEHMMRRQLNGLATPKECESWTGDLATNGFCALGESLQRMGLGSANMLIVYYMPAWPFVLSATMMASLANEEPSAALIKAAFGSTTAYRKSKSRHPDDFEPWPTLLRRAARQLVLAPLVTKAPVTVAPPTQSTVRSHFTARRDVVLFLREVLAGRPEAEAAHRHGLGASVAARAIRCLDRQSKFRGAVRHLGSRGERGRRAILRSLNSVAGDQLLAALGNSSASDVEALLKDLCGSRLGSDAPRTEEVIGRLYQHLQCIPPTLNLTLRPRHAVADPAISSLLAQLSARVRLESPKAGRAPALFVYTRGKHTNLVTIGRMTDLLRISALAVHVANQLSDKE